MSETAKSRAKPIDFTTDPVIVATRQLTHGGLHLCIAHAQTTGNPVIINHHGEPFAQLRAVTPGETIGKKTALCSTDEFNRGRNGERFAAVRNGKPFVITKYRQPAAIIEPLPGWIMHVARTEEADDATEKA